MKKKTKKTKICFKCGKRQKLCDFYAHREMRDGCVNKCKKCTKKDVKANRLKRIEYYRAFDRKRGNRQSPDYGKKYVIRYPNKNKATCIVFRAIKNGKLSRQPCVICGSKKVHAHHDDYAKPLNVRWLCVAHHSQWHAKHGEASNSF